MDISFPSASLNYVNYFYKNAKINIKGDNIYMGFPKWLSGKESSF